MMVFQRDFFARHAFAQNLVLFLNLLKGILRLVLKRRKRLRHKGGDRDCYIDALPFGTSLCAVIQIDDALRKLDDTADVIWGFGGQAQHEIELDRGIAALKGQPAALHDVLFGNIFIDDVAHPLSSGLRREGESAFSHCFNAFQQFFRKVIDAEGGQRYIDVARLGIVEQLAEQRFDLGIVARTQRGERDLFIAGGLAEAFGFRTDGVRFFLTKRAVKKARLTETASADTAAQNLYDGTVVNGTDKRHDEVFRIEYFVEILYNALFDFLGRSVFWRDGGNRTVCVIAYLIEAWHIHAAELRRFFEEGLLRVAGLPACLIEIHQFMHHLFAFAEHE